MTDYMEISALIKVLKIARENKKVRDDARLSNELDYIIEVLYSARDGRAVLDVTDFMQWEKRLLSMNFDFVRAREMAQYMYKIAHNFLCDTRVSIHDCHVWSIRRYIVENIESALFD